MSTWHGGAPVAQATRASMRWSWRPGCPVPIDDLFPITRMEPIGDAFHGDDARAMAADDTSGFNCRWVTGHPGVWSAHAFGLAIDVNPLEDPYVTGNAVAPRGAEPFADRSLNAPGMIHAGDVVVRAFAAIGWWWGGSWSTLRDYQHFSPNGR